MTEEQQLIHRYLHDGSRAALEELIARNLNLVYSAALRQVRDAHLAEDVTQAVFLVLAQKVRTIRAGVAVGGWLLSVTRHASLNAMRKRANQHRHERAAAKPEMVRDEPVSWEQIAPVLDSAMSRLRVADRDAVVLRFFQDKSFAEVGAEIGLSAEAARKRVNRALDRLRQIIRARGVESELMGLSSVLLAHAVCAAPSGLKIAAVAASAKAGAAGIAKGVINMMAWTKIMQAGIATATVIALGAVTVPVWNGGFRSATALAQNQPAPEPRPLAVTEQTLNQRKITEQNLIAIRAAMNEYSVDHRGLLPPDLGELVNGDYARINLFIRPGSNMPLNLTSPAQRGGWLKANADYAYLGGGLPNSDGFGKLVLAYEKQAHEAGGLQLLFGDGHVEFMPLDAAGKTIESSKFSTRQLRCQHNLLRIDRSLKAFANAHNGAYPADLGSLLVWAQKTPQKDSAFLTYSIGEQGLASFLCAHTDKSLPAEWAGMTPDEQAGWINLNIDYGYAGTGLTKARVKASTVIAYENNPKEHEIGAHLLFGDGHVEFMTPQQAQASIAQSAKERAN